MIQEKWEQQLEEEEEEEQKQHWKETVEMIEQYCSLQVQKTPVSAGSWITINCAATVFCGLSVVQVKVAFWLCLYLC